MLFSFSTSIAAATRVVKSYYYDYNTVFKYDTNYTYIDIPNNAYYSHQKIAKVGGGWNYNRYQVMKYYKNGGKYY